MITSGRFAALLAAVLAAPAARAQQPPPGDSPYGTAQPGAIPRTPPVSQPPAALQASAGTAMPNQQWAAPPPQFAPPSYSPPWGVPYIQSPANGYLTGVAAVTTANGEYLSQVQQARQLQTQADMSKLDLRVRMAQTQRYLQSLQPTTEEMRQQDIMDSINRSRNNPPAGEIWSGRALNSLLTAIQNAIQRGLTGPDVPLDPNVLRHINLTSGTTTAGTGVARNVTRFTWPLPLLDEAFGDSRRQIEGLAHQAAEQAPSGVVDPKLIRDLRGQVRALTESVRAKVADFSPSEYTQSIRYLRELGTSFQVLSDPNVASYFTGNFQATGRNVAELVQGMSGRGLRFAPAATGDERFYTVLHGAMVAYDYGLRNLAAR
jgi:hypothetical protein